MVRNRMMKPQNVRKCAVPGTDHFSSLRCPSTSVTSVPASRAGMLPDRLDPLRRRLAGPAEPVEPPQPPAGDGERDRGQGESDDDA